MDIFSNKITIITGGASGIGRALGETLIHRGATVIFADINEKGAEEAVEAVKNSVGQAKAVSLNVTNADDVKTLVNDIVS